MLKLQFRQQNMIPVLLSHHLSAPARRQLFGTVDIKVENIDIYYISMYIIIDIYVDIMVAAVMGRCSSGLSTWRA